MKSALALLLLALAAALAFPAPPAYAQIELTEAEPPDGARLSAPPDVVHLCFSQPVIVEDDTTYDFSYQMPDGHNLGLLIVFKDFENLEKKEKARCVDVQPGLPDEYPAGEYTFEWKVTAAEGDEESSGTLRFQVSPGRTLAQEDDEGGPEILFLALITTASVGGAAVLFTLGYFLRRRIGYEPHRPPEGDEEGEGH